jgi:hypothetical protein
VKRRAFLRGVGWALTLAGASIVVALFRREYRTRAISHPSSRKSSTAERRKRSRQAPLWTSTSMIWNDRSRTLHWPHPALFKYRTGVSARHAVKIRIDAWRTQLAEEVDTEMSSHYSPHFERRKAPIIRETLALASLTVDPSTLRVDGLDTALDILRPVVHPKQPPETPAQTRLPAFFGAPKQSNTELTREPRLSPNPIVSRAGAQSTRGAWLYARLICLKHEGDLTTAWHRVRDLPPWAAHSHSIAWQGPPDQERQQAAAAGFSRFHGRTVLHHAHHRTFRRRLALRVEEAKAVLGTQPVRDSSSGKDTLRGEESSNLSSRATLKHRRRPWLSRVRKRARQRWRLLVDRFRSGGSKRSRTPD